MTYKNKENSMDSTKILKEFKKFIEKNRKELYSKSISASSITEDDEWMQEDNWDKIYKKDIQKNAKI